MSNATLTETMISRSNLTQIELLRFPLVVGVVFLHNDVTTNVHMQGYNVDFTTENPSLIGFVVRSISGGLAGFAVPIFFLMAGYLFFYGSKYSIKTYIEKLKRRIGSLLIPFLFWNVLTIIVFALGEQVHFTARFFTYWDWPPIAHFRVLDYLNAIFGIWAKEPISFQFWFIRDLMVLVLLVPIIHFMLSGKFGLPSVVLLFALMIAKEWPFSLSSAEATSWFCAGCYLSLRQIRVAGTSRWAWLISVPALLAIIVNAIQPENPFAQYLPSIRNVFGVPAVWWLFGLIDRRTVRLRAWLARASAWSFWIFAAHEPLLRITQKIVIAICPKGTAAVLFEYFTVPIIVIIFLIGIYERMKSLTPRILAIITGNRSTA
jgi:surface polysaccharide O-acyltransferase-like enzyme